MKQRWRPSWIALLIGAIIVLLSIGGFFFLQHSVDQQETALLQSQTTDVARRPRRSSGASPPASRMTPQWSGSSPPHDPTTFSTTCSRAAKGGVRAIPGPQDGDRYVVSCPPAQPSPPAEALAAALATVQKVTGRSRSAGPVMSNGKMSTPASPFPPLVGLYLYAQFAIPGPHRHRKTIGRRVQRPQCGLVRPGPIAPEFAGDGARPIQSPWPSSRRSLVHIGASNWTLVATARTPFVTGLASSGPWILLSSGLFIALVVAMTVRSCNDATGTRKPWSRSARAT